MYYTKELGAQHLLVIFAGAGIIHHPCFLAQATITTKTDTAKRLRERFGLTDKEFPILLQTIAHALGVSLQTAENVLCEALRYLQKTDLYIPGQWLYRLRDTRAEGLFSVGANDRQRYVVERFHPLDKSVPPEEVPPYSPVISPKGEEKWRAFSQDRPASSFRTMRPNLVRKKRAFKSVYFRTVKESLDYIRSAQHTLFDLKERLNLFLSIHSDHSLATNDRVGKKRRYQEFFLQKLGREDDEWCDLVCRLRPFARFVNEDRLAALGHFNEKTMRAWVDRPIVNRRRRAEEVAIEHPSQYCPPPLELNDKEQEHVRRVKRRIADAVSGPHQEKNHTLFTEKDRLTGNERGKSEVNTADVLGWVFDTNEPQRIVQESLANGFKATPSLFGARVYRPRGKKAMPSLASEPASDDLRHAAAPSQLTLGRTRHTCIEFNREKVGDKQFRALTDHSAWKYPPTLAEWSKDSYCIEDFLHSPASCSRTNMAHCFDLGMFVRILVGSFRVHYLEINGGGGRGRAFAAFLERVEAPSTSDTKRIVLGSLPEADSKFKYVHPRGLVRSLSGTQCMGSMTPPHFYEDKASAKTALFFYILLNYVGDDPLVRSRTITRMIFRKYAKSSILVNAHTLKATNDVCSCMFHVDNGKAFILLPPSSTEGGVGGEQATSLVQPLVLPL